MNVVGGGDTDGHVGVSNGGSHQPSEHASPNWRPPSKNDDRYGTAGGVSTGVRYPGGGGGAAGSGTPVGGSADDYGRPYDRYPIHNEYGESKALL